MPCFGLEATEEQTKGCWNAPGRTLDTVVSINWGPVCGCPCNEPYTTLGSIFRPRILYSPKAIWVWKRMFFPSGRFSGLHRSGDMHVSYYVLFQTGLQFSLLRSSRAMFTDIPYVPSPTLARSSQTLLHSRIHRRLIAPRDHRILKPRTSRGLWARDFRAFQT